MQVTIADTPEKRQAAFEVRKLVFVQEQKVPESLEIDDLENDAIHFVCYIGQTPVGASRLRLLEHYGKLERIAVLIDYRGQSIGTKIIRVMEQEIIDNGINKSKLNAQTHAIKFYEALGYQVISGKFMDAGIPHVTMTKQLNKA